MSDINDLKEFYGLLGKPRLRHQDELLSGSLLAKKRERQKRERKEKLYSYSREVIQPGKRCNILS